jgi:hypothetical protein
VQDGTAKRAKTAFVKDDGSVIALGGKTGTGDQRFDVFGAGHRLIESRYVNRSATFVFNIGERFFGSMTAYVHGPDSAHYDFTSALPVQLLVKLAPSLMPMIAHQDTVTIPGLHVERAAPAPAGPTDAVARDTEQAAPADAPADAAPADAKSADAKAPAEKPAAKSAAEPAAKPAVKAAAESAAKPAAKAAEKPAAKGAGETHPKAAADAAHAAPHKQAADEHAAAKPPIARKADGEGQPKPAARKPDADAQPKAKPAPHKPAVKTDADAEAPAKAQHAKPPAVEEVLQ